MRIDEIIKKIADGEHGKIKFALSDIDGVLRGKIIHKEKFLEIINKSIGFCDVIFGWDCVDACYDNVSYTGWHSGYPNAPVVLDPDTFRTIPWENHIPFFLGNLAQPDGRDADICPRGLLKKITRKSHEMGFDPVYALEYEWFNFTDAPEELQPKEFTRLRSLTPGMFGYSLLRPSLHSEFFNSLFDWLEQFDVRLESLHTETGPGVYEAAIRYSDALNAADKAILFKTAVKEIAHRFGITASFMAKWNMDLPGCGGHIHQSLWDPGHQRNYFEHKTNNALSDVARQFIAGQILCLPEILPLYAPTINSYKRLGGGAWAPSIANWGVDNRTTSLRYIPGEKKDARLEMRVPGADANPYLVIAAALASGLYGIANRLRIENEAVKGNGYHDQSGRPLPATLQDATRIMKQSKIAGELFGTAFVEHFTATREWECRQYEKQVSDWELKRYFEII